jgi:hypothetical protein
MDRFLPILKIGAVTVFEPLGLPTTQGRVGTR